MTIDPKYLTLLNTDSALERQKAARSLGRSRDADAVEPLLDRLWQEQDKVVRSAIIDALNRIGDQRVVEPLLQMLRSEVDPVRGEQILTVVIRLGGPSIADELLTLLSIQRSPFIQVEIVRLLGKIRYQNAVQPLMDLLAQLDYQQSYHNQSLRTAALRSLGELRDPRAVPQLLAMLKTKTARQHEIINALGLIGDKRALPTVHHYMLHAADVVTRSAAKRAFINLVDEDELDMLLDLLDYDDLEMRVTAVRLVGQFGDGRAIDDLVRILDDPRAQLSKRSDEDTNLRLRQEALNALVAIGDKQAIPHLRRYWLWPAAWRAMRQIRRQ